MTLRTVSAFGLAVPRLRITAFSIENTSWRDCAGSKLAVGSVGSATMSSTPLWNASPR